MNLQVLLSTVNLIERRSVTSDYHGSRFSGSQQFFFNRDSYWHCGAMEEKYWATVLFPSAIVQFFQFFFFLRYLQDHGLLKSGDFATMAT